MAEHRVVYGPLEPIPGTVTRTRIRRGLFGLEVGHETHTVGRLGCRKFTFWRDEQGNTMGTWEWVDESESWVVG